MSTLDTKNIKIFCTVLVNYQLLIIIVPVIQSNSFVFMIGAYRSGVTAVTDATIMTWLIYIDFLDSLNAYDCGVVYMYIADRWPF